MERVILSDPEILGASPVFISMGDEARDILRNARNAESVVSPLLGDAIHALFAPLGGFDVPPIEREPMREPPGFDARFC